MRPPLVPQPIPINDNESRLIKHLKTLYNHLVEYREIESGRIVISLFMCLPSRKEFPEYFEIIQKPISMYEIRKRIETEQYHAEESCINDFKLMFNNCRIFNEDGSQIFRDSVNLEAMLMKKHEQLMSENGHAKQQQQQQHNKQADVKQPDKDIKQNNRDIKHNNSNGVSTNSAPPKKRLLTGYIIYAAEVRKEYVDKHPNQDFGFISRLIGNDWKALPRDLRTKYDQRAVAHNLKIKERLEREGISTTQDGSPRTPANGYSTPKLSKKKLAKLAREQMRLNQTSTPYAHDNSTQSPKLDHPSHMVPQATSLPHKYDYRQQNYSQPSQSMSQTFSTKTTTVDSATQTAPIRFVEPNDRRAAYSENFKRYIESLEIPNKDLLEEEIYSDRQPGPPPNMLGNGIGRYESTEAALWALRDFMLQDSDSMKWSVKPYLCYQ